MIVSDNIFWRILRFLQLNRVYRILKGTAAQSFDEASTNKIQRSYSLSEKELESKYRLVWTRLLEMEVNRGDYLEFCQARGLAMACMHRVIGKLKLSSVRLISLEMTQQASNDTSVVNDDPGSTSAKPFQTGIQLQSDGEFSEEKYFIKARFNDSLTGDFARKHELIKASVIMIDCNNYDDAKAALNFASPLILDHTMIFINNSHNNMDSGENLAYAEFLKENSHLKSLPFRSYKPNGRIYFVTSMRVG